jgi:membrane-bound metal-dependent hydrolase YbcI (DUF457 family)
MAGFRTHVGFAAAAGVGYGYGAVVGLQVRPDVGVLAGAVTAAGGMLPDLDSEPGRPVREVFGLAAAVVPVLLVPRLQHAGLTHETILTVLVVCYLVIRYGAPKLLGQVTVHRGMFHSIPAMLICGLVVYLEYGSPDRLVRLVLAGGVMLGFLSHLVLDEIYSVDFNGVRLKLKSSAGSALKFFSDSVWGTVCCYTLLGALLYTAYLDWLHIPQGEPPPIPFMWTK